MQSRQKLILGLAGVFAIIGGLLAWQFFSSLTPTQVVQHTRTVYVAAKDLQARAPINPSMLETVQRPDSAVDRDAIVSTDQLQGAIAATTIPQGSIITLSRLARPDSAPLTARMPRGVRAVTVAIDPVRGDANLVQPGDRVDVISIQHGPQTEGVQENDTSDKSKAAPVQTILRGAMVLAMGHRTEGNQAAGSTTTDAGNGSDATTVTLALNPKDAEELAYADSTSSLRLSLRPAKETIPKTVSVPYIVLTPPPTQRQAPVVTARQMLPNITILPGPKPHHANVGITVIDGDHVIGGGGDTK